MLISTGKARWEPQIRLGTAHLYHLRSNKHKQVLAALAGAVQELAALRIVSALQRSCVKPVCENQSSALLGIQRQELLWLARRAHCHGAGSAVPAEFGWCCATGIGRAFPGPSRSTISPWHCTVSLAFLRAEGRCAFSARLLTCRSCPVQKPE